MASSAMSAPSAARSRTVKAAGYRANETSCTVSMVGTGENGGATMRGSATATTCREPICARPSSNPLM